MKLQRTCKICLDPFTAIKVTQYFCKRKCFKRDYYLRNKERLAVEHYLPTFPVRTCALCGNSQMIPYDPIKQSSRFNSWECTDCGVTNALLWKHQDSPRSYQTISAILKSVQVHSFLLTKPSELTIRASFITIITGSPEAEQKHPVLAEPVTVGRNYSTTVVV